MLNTIFQVLAPKGGDDDDTIGGGQTWTNGSGLARTDSSPQLTK